MRASKQTSPNLQISHFWISENSNPNGSIQNIAGVFNEKKNILGMMPHPERVIDSCLSSNDGSYFFENLLSNMK